ncbi:hypothetical protein BDE02_02G062800 [Populus trichocarpa]|nr:hypothetical protein BDE02_02G062800 [Populus trichocarpa]
MNHNHSNNPCSLQQRMFRSGWTLALIQPITNTTIETRMADPATTRGGHSLVLLETGFFLFVAASLISFPIPWLSLLPWASLFLDLYAGCGVSASFFS